MADLTTVSGGSKLGVSSLSPAEHQAAIKALSKLGGASSASHGVSSVFGGKHLTNVTLSGGSVHPDSAKLSSGSLSAGVPKFASIGSDTVVAGSAFSSTAHTAVGKQNLSVSDTVKVAGATAAGVKQESAQGATAGHTITLADKTTVTLTGVNAHDVAKPH